ncbi:MAG: tetratricopeptide repeat protein [Exilispira sp.]
MDKRNSIKEIERAINLTEYNKAIDLILKEIKYNGPKDDLMILLAETYIKADDIKNAVKIYENLYNSDKNNPVYTFKFIELKIVLRLYNEAKKILDELPEKLKEDWQYYFLFGKLNYEQKNYEMAINNLSKAYNKNPKNIDILLILAEISFLINKFNDAIRYYLTILKLNNNIPKAYENLGLIYYKLGKKKESFNAFLKANKLKPNSPNILKMIGLYQIEEGDYRQALKNLEKAYNLEPKAIDTMVFLGYTYEKIKVFEKAEELYYKATTLSKENPEPYLHLAQLYEKQELTEKALKILGEAEIKFGKNEKIKIETGKAAIQIKDYEKAKSYFIEVLKENSNSEEALFGLAFSLELSGNLDEANVYYSKLLEINPENQQGLLRKGMVLFSLGEKSGAQYYLSKLIEKDPKNEEANIILGQIKLEDNQFLDALYYLENVKKSNPDNIQPYLILGSYYKNNNKLKEAVEEYSAILNLSRFKNINSMEEFNNILESYEEILNNYEKEIKSRNETVLNKFKEKNLEKANFEDEKKSIQESIEKLFDQVDESIGTKIDEIDEESEYSLISKILDGEFTEEAESSLSGIDSSSKILDYLSDGVFSPDEYEEEAEEIIEKKAKKNEKSEDEKLLESEEDTDIFDKIPFDTIKEKKIPFDFEQKKISEDEDISLLSEMKKDNIPSSLEEAYSLNEKERIKDELKNFQQPAIQQHIMQQPVIQQPYTIQPAIQQPIAQQPIVDSSMVQQPKIYQQPITQQPIVDSSMVQQPKIYQQPDYFSNLDSQTLYNQNPVSQYPIITQQDMSENKPLPSESYPQDGKLSTPIQKSFDSSQNVNTPSDEREKSNELIIDETESEEFPEFLFDTDSEKEKQDIKNSPDYFESVEPILPESLNEQIPVEESHEQEENLKKLEDLNDNFNSENELDKNKEDRYKKGKPDDLNMGKNNKGLVNLGLLRFGPPRPEVIKELLHLKPKSLNEKKEFLSKSIKEIGKFLFMQISDLPIEIQEKATLSKNFQTFIKFMENKKNA